VKPFAQHVGQRAVVGAGDVLDFEPRGVGFGSGAHRADQGNAAFQRPQDQRQLGREGVDRIDRVVEPCRVEQQVGFFVLDVFIDYVEFECRVDVPQPLGQHLGFGPSDGRVEGHQLAVDIGRIDRVGIGDGHAPHACPDDHLGGIGAHAAQSYDQHVGRTQFFEFFRSQQELRSFEPVVSHRSNISL
jgi:hypothetical protein